VAEGRERALQKAEEALTKIRNGLGGRYYKTRKQVDDKVATVVGSHLAGLLTVTTGTRAGKPTVSWHRNHDAITATARTDGVYALATNLTGPLSATKVLRIYKDQPLVEVRHHDAKATLRVRPIFLHNDDRIDALVSIVGLALVVFGLLESDLRNTLGPDEQLDGLLPEGRAARPTGRNILAAFQGFGLTYGPDGITLDRLTHTQRRILELLEVTLPWPEQARPAPVNCGKRD
jgi:transposase